MNVYHYTTRHLASAILKSGHIDPATKFIPRNEKPVVWFSRNPLWEPTAAKGILEDGATQPRTATFAEMLSVGIARFGISDSGLIPWRDIPRCANIRPKMVRALERMAREQDARPRDWFGSLQPVPIIGLTLDVFDGHDWQRIGILGEGQP